MIATVGRREDRSGQPGEPLNALPAVGILREASADRTLSCRGVDLIVGRPGIDEPLDSGYTVSNTHHKLKRRRNRVSCEARGYGTESGENNDGTVLSGTMDS
jgi:hypothetical protein